MTPETETETLDTTPEPVAPEEGAPESAEPEDAAPEPSFAEQLTERIDAALGEREPEGEGDAETEPEEGEAAAPEAEAAEAGEEPAAEAEAEEADTAEEEAADDGDSDADEGDSLVLRLPGRNEDDPDIEVPLTAEQLEAAGVDPQAFVERQNQLRNGYMRGQEVRAEREEIRGEREELDFIYRELQTRPEDFVAGTVHPSHYPGLVRTMLLKLDDDQYDAVLTDIAKIDADDSTRKTERLKLREKEIERKDEKRQRAASSEYVTAIRKEITRLVPEDMPDEKAKKFFDFAVYQLEAWARGNPGKRIETDQVPALLQELGALDPYGITANGDADARTDAATTPEDARRKPRPADPELAERAKRTGKDLTKRAESRKKAAATAPAGAGAAANPGLKAQLKGLSFEEKMKRLKASPLKLDS